MIEMLVQSRPGHVELLSALPAAASSSTCAGGTARPSRTPLHSVGGRTTTVSYAGTTRRLRLTPGGSVTLRDLAP
ncbi:hypothetical protein AB0G20_11120 [Streptomyces sp. NPDC024017]|uniref:hypothetical protein n=1 Tax=Streptomyces sp. NPDC024017 TaxID=3154326 RepID=UPI00340D016C